jgi:hypothetical protein
MSRFFRALEQAERDRAMRDGAPRPAAAASGVESPPAVAPAIPIARASRHGGSPPRTAASEPVLRPPSDALTSGWPHPGATAAGSPADLGGIDEHLASLLAPASLAAEH